MHRISFFIILTSAVLLAACGNDSSSIGSTATAHQAGDSGSETRAPTQQREITLAVPGMNCPMCPITVRKALARVDGVSEAAASLEHQQAHVVFDPAKTSIDALIAAVAAAGFTATEPDARDE
ncbi:MAG: hypothetical protein Tsb0027_01790 [Wenzhouxiangellaceae bacterium]